MDYDQIATALSKAQAEIKAAEMDATNPFFKSKYSTLTAVWDACRKALTSNGLSVVQVTREVEAGTKLVTILLHASGQRIKSELLLRPKDNSPQAIGSALTYARRYALAAMVGVSSVEDDDGEATTNHGNQSQRTKVDKKTGEVIEPSKPNGNSGNVVNEPMTLYWQKVKDLKVDRGHAQDLLKEYEEHGGPEEAIKYLEMVK